jgi:hypothetical protein
LLFGIATVISAYQDDENYGIEPFSLQSRRAIPRMNPGELACLFRFRQMAVLSGGRIGSLPRSR